MIPQSSRYVIVGAGVHGLSTAWHLAAELKAANGGDGGDVVVLDKTGVGAGASGIACGIVRNNYFQPAMRRLMAHSVGVWEAHQDALSYHPVGYVQISPEQMYEGVAEIYEQQRAIGYDSAFVEGAAAARSYMESIFPDWQAQGVTSVLHEKRGGYANNVASVRGLAAMAEAEGVRILTGISVTGLDLDGGAVCGVETTEGTIRCEHLVVAAGPWVRDLWTMLDLPKRVTVRTRKGENGQDRDMWTYRLVQEGTLKVDPDSLTDSHGDQPPVVHVDTDAPLYDDAGELVTDDMWGSTTSPIPTSAGCRGAACPE